MEFRTLGRTGLRVSAISLGTEYIYYESRQQAIDVIHAALDQQVNYFDIFWPNPTFRETMGMAFAGRRQEVLLTAHLGAAYQEDGQYQITRDPAKARDLIHECLRLYRTDTIDVLFLHNYNHASEVEQMMAPGGLLAEARRLQQEGKARFLGFSGHNTRTAQQVVESGAIDVLMFPVNLACQAVPGFQELLHACVQQNIGLVAMKPFGGGSLLRKEQILEIEDFQLGRTEVSGGPTRFQKTVEITPVQCLEYVLRQPGVSTIVPGCKNLAELNGALACFDASPAERDLADILPCFAEYPAGQCVYCNHCLPCPAGIDIGKVNSLLDQAATRSEAKIRPAAELQAEYNAMPAKASECLACGDCESRCPYGVAVSSRMEQAAALFER